MHGVQFPHSCADTKNNRRKFLFAHPKPKFTFQNVLLYGQSNYSIKILQDILKYENLFPLNITSTGNYLQITAKAVLAWQRKHKVASESELSSLMGKRVGEKTIKALNSIYS